MEWFKNFLSGFKEWLIDVLLYIPRKLFDSFLNALAGVIEGLPLPSFIVDYSLGDLIDPNILWLLHSSGVSTALSIISSAIVFRILRKILTFGMW